MCRVVTVGHFAKPLRTTRLSMYFGQEMALRSHRRYFAKRLLAILRTVLALIIKQTRIFHVSKKIMKIWTKRHFIPLGKILISKTLPISGITHKKSETELTTRILYKVLFNRLCDLIRPNSFLVGR